MVSWVKAQRVNNPTDKRFIEYFQIVYNYTTEKFVFNFRLVESGVGTFTGVIENDILIYGKFLPIYTRLENQSFELDIDEPVPVEPDLEPGPVIPVEPAPPLVYGSLPEWETVNEWDEGADYERRVQRRKK